MSSPGYFDVLGLPCKSRLSVIYSAALCNALLRSLTVHPRSSKMLFPVTPWIKTTHGDLQILPSSHFPFRAFKNKVKRKRRAWFLLPRGAVSVSGCLTGASQIAQGLEATREQRWAFWPPKIWWQKGGGFVSERCHEAHIGVGSSSTGVKSQWVRTPEDNRKFRLLEVCALGAVIFLLNIILFLFLSWSPEINAFKRSLMDRFLKCSLYCLLVLFPPVSPALWQELLGRLEHEGHTASHQWGTWSKPSQLLSERARRVGCLHGPRLHLAPRWWVL